MDQTWLQHRPRLAPLVRSFDALLKLADEQYQQGRANGEAIDYANFEERVAHVTAKVEQDVHRIALSGLDVDVPFIRVWGKHYRRVHRIARTYGSLSGPVAVERTLYRELGQRLVRSFDALRNLLANSTNKAVRTAKPSTTPTSKSAWRMSLQRSSRTCIASH